MKRLVVASNNAGKIKEIKEILGDFYDEIVSLKELSIDIDVEEDGLTFHENALKKAAEVSKLAPGDVLADDSGLCVTALGGAPGIYSARYAGPNASDDENNTKLIGEMAGIADRSAKFVCALVVANGGKEKYYIEDSVEGVITNEAHGESGFGYDPLFYYEKLGKTFGELPPETKNSLSHRAKALRRLAIEMNNG